MNRFLPDTSCLVAAVCSWHEDHEATRSELDRRRVERERLVLAAHSLLETYAVLTRLPAPHRLGEADALTLLEANWGRADVVGLTPREHWEVLKTCRRLGAAGGQTYDALIAACARKAGARTLLTWNRRHFERLAPGLAVLSPEQR